MEQKNSASGQDATWYDVVVTRSGPDCPRYIPCRSKELYVASGEKAFWLFHHSGVVGRRTQTHSEAGRIGITSKIISEGEIIAFLRESGLRFSAFGENYSYPPEEAVLIRRWESETQPWWRFTIETPTKIERDGRCVWLEVPPPPYGHRSCASHGVIAFHTEDDAVSYLDYLKLDRPHLVEKKLVAGYVFDPDVDRGDFGIDVVNPEAIPGPIGKSASSFRFGYFVMRNRGIVPQVFVPGMFDMESGLTFRDYIGTRDLARFLGVTQPRLSSWLREQGWLVKNPDTDEWMPSPDLGIDTVAVRRDERYDALLFRWHPRLIEDLKDKKEEIAASAVKWESRPPAPPTEAQINYINNLVRELGLPPAEMPTSKKQATKVLQGLIEQHEQAKAAGTLASKTEVG